MSPIKGRLINVSNRLPVHIKKHAGGARVSRSAGGLVSALGSVWREQPGIWIGWGGEVDMATAEPLLAKASKGQPYKLQGIELSDDEVAKFYAGFANEIIWPLFHDVPSRCNFDPDYWEVYQRVNRRFAKAAADAATDETDLIWVHDYHLMLVGQYLIETGSRARAGYFLHIPFPAPDIFEKLPWREAVLRALLKFDLVGFQTDRDRCNFISCVKRLVPDAIVESGDPYTSVNLQGRRSLIGTFPISVAFDELAAHAAKHKIAERAATLRRELNENILVLGVDRMDYTKGIPERLRAFHILLRRFPEMRHKITLVQVVVPSREEVASYKQLRREVELLVSQINGEFTEPGWVPIHYMHRSLNRGELLAYYRAADIALITSLKDGMNLVAKEFCAAQIDERGVVIISEFAGAAPEMREDAMLVNPYDFAEVALALHEASIMPPEEKRYRMQHLRALIKINNVQRWAESFQEAASSSEVGLNQAEQKLAS
jgi:alpha,alpha-trehalose-phosphate synthase [UDP-forming]